MSLTLNCLLLKHCRVFPIRIAAAADIDDLRRAICRALLLRVDARALELFRVRGKLQETDDADPEVLLYNGSPVAFAYPMAPVLHEAQRMDTDGPQSLRSFFPSSEGEPFARSERQCIHVLVRAPYPTMLSEQDAFLSELWVALHSALDAKLRPLEADMQALLDRVETNETAQASRRVGGFGAKLRELSECVLELERVWIEP